eukprot:15020259-Alexandrium_andersonii.AAC.1
MQVWIRFSCISEDVLGSVVDVAAGNVHELVADSTVAPRPQGQDDASDVALLAEGAAVARVEV